MSDVLELRVAAAERERDMALHQAREAQGIAIDNALNAQRQAMEALKSEVASGLASGDAEAVAVANSKLLQAELNMQQLQRGKAEILQTMRKQPQPISVESFIGHNARILSEDQKPWLREHPEAVENPQNLQTLVAAYQVAQRRGLKPDSDEYRNFFDDTFGFVGGGRTESRGGRSPMRMAGGDKLSDQEREVALGGLQPRQIQL
jgi:hypothetical protein